MALPRERNEGAQRDHHHHQTDRHRRPRAIAAGLTFIVIQFVHLPESAVTVTSLVARWAALLLVAGSVITILVPVLPHAFERLLALPVGVGLAALGYSLWSGQRNVSTQSDIGPRDAELDPIGTR